MKHLPLIALVTLSQAATAEDVHKNVSITCADGYSFSGTLIGIGPHEVCTYSTYPPSEQHKDALTKASLNRLYSEIDALRKELREMKSCSREDHVSGRLAGDCLHAEDCVP
jgi:hypothetical protein